jgi:hypothetical protein
MNTAINNTNAFPISAREHILLKVLEVLSPIAQSCGATLHRSPTVALDKSECPALVVFAELEKIEKNNMINIRTLQIRIVALARAVEVSAAETEADKLMTAAYRALWTSSNLDGLAQSLRDIEWEWEIEEADGVVAAIPMKMQIEYRTAVGYLTP